MGGGLLYVLVISSVAKPVITFPNHFHFWLQSRVGSSKSNDEQKKEKFYFISLAYLAVGKITK